MAWESVRVACAIALQDICEGVSLADMLRDANYDGNDFVFASSRRGVLVETLRSICVEAGTGTELYLLKNEAVLSGAELDNAIGTIQSLLLLIASKPEIVLEATKYPHKSTVDIHMAGFEPHVFKVVDPPEAVIKDGYVYLYTKEDVLSALHNAVSAQNPRPADDDDGESIGYAFGFLKSHLSLLQTAAQSGKAVAYAELNPAA